MELAILVKSRRTLRHLVNKWSLSSPPHPPPRHYFDPSDYGTQVQKSGGGARMRSKDCRSPPYSDLKRHRHPSHPVLYQVHYTQPQ